MITAEQIAGIMGCTPKLASKWHPHLNSAMSRFDITSPARQAAFLAQVGHESGRLQYVREIWNPTQCPWQLHYEGRVDLGNTEPGDGFKYRGRGLIQITGRKNYIKCSQALGRFIETKPELLELPEFAAASAAWFWKVGAGLNLSKQAFDVIKKLGFSMGVDLNELADSGQFDAITLCINGGWNGLADRRALFETARKVLLIQGQST